MKKNRRQSETPRRPSNVDAANRLTKLEGDFHWTAAIFLVAFILRLFYLVQIDSIPLFYHLAGDGRTYDEWAQRIAGGDWLGQGVFYQAPLYPYFLGALQMVFGHNLWLIRFFQILLGSLSCALIYCVGKQLFSRRAGIAAGFLLAVYTPAIFFDALIEKSILDLCLLSLLLLLLVQAMVRQRWQQWLACGIVLGLFGLSRENALVWVAIVAPWICFYFSNQSRTMRARWAAWFFAGMLLILIPVGMRNWFIGGEFKLTTSQLGANFFIGNNSAADGTYGSVRKIIGEPQLEGSDATRLAERAAGRSLSAGEVSDYWLKKSLDYIRSAPGRSLGLLAKKWLMVWNAREVEDSDDFYIYGQWSGVLALLGWVSHFGVLVPLAAAGLWLTRRDWRRLSLFYAMIVGFALSVAVFYIFGRYRFPLVPLLALFAGAGLATVTGWFGGGLRRDLLPTCAVWLVSAAIVNWPLYGFNGPGAPGYNNLSNAYYKQGRVEEAIRTARRALEIQPDYGLADYNLGNLYAGQGQFDLARKYFEEALRLYPNYAEAQANLGQLIAERGDLDTGIRYFRKAIELNPSISRAHLNLGVALAKQGKLDEAIPPLERAAQLKVDSPEASFYLGSVYAAQNRYGDAEAAFAHALRIEPDFAPAHQSLAQLLALQGKKAEAMQHYQEALRLSKSGPAR